MDNQRLIENRIRDYIKIAANSSIPVYTDFLDLNQQSIAIALLYKVKGIEYEKFGGYDFAERSVIGIKSVFCDMNFDFNCIHVLKITFDVFHQKWNTHRNILGSMIGLGYERKMLGDILVADEKMAFVFILGKVAKHVCDLLVTVGKANVSIEAITIDQLELKQKPGEIKSKTVASLRLDAVLGCALNLSRNKACALIGSQVVYVNFRLIDKTDYGLKQDDVISVRKKGRFKIFQVGGNSTKGRVWVSLECFFE